MHPDEYDYELPPELIAKFPPARRRDSRLLVVDRDTGHCSDRSFADLPEYLRAFSEYRMLMFGAILVTMMVFRPGGIVSSVRRTYQFEGVKQGADEQH